MRKPLTREIQMDPLIKHIEALSQLHGGKEFFRGIVQYTKDKLAEKLKKWFPAAEPMWMLGAEKGK